MKTRSALLFMVALLMVSADSGSAVIFPCPCDLRLSLDNVLVTHDFNQQAITPDTVRGSVQDMSGFGARFTVKITNAPQWVILTKIRGKVVQDGDIIDFAANEMLPVELIIVPYAERPDTENYCLSLLWEGSKNVGGGCIKLAMTNNISAVSPDQSNPNIILEPNPAENYMFVRGLDGAQTGYRYEIFSISGADVRHGMLPADARINLQDLSSGAYRLLLFDGKRMLTNSAITVLH